MAKDPPTAGLFCLIKAERKLYTLGSGEQCHKERDLNQEGRPTNKTCTLTLWALLFLGMTGCDHDDVANFNLDGSYRWQQYTCTVPSKQADNTAGKVALELNTLMSQSQAAPRITFAGNTVTWSTIGPYDIFAPHVSQDLLTAVGVTRTGCSIQASAKFSVTETELSIYEIKYSFENDCDETEKASLVLMEKLTYSFPISRAKHLDGRRDVRVNLTDFKGCQTPSSELEGMNSTLIEE